MRTQTRVQRSVAFCKLASLYARRFIRRDNRDEFTSLALVAWLTPHKRRGARTTKQAMKRAQNQLERSSMGKLPVIAGDAWRDTNNRTRRLDKTMSKQATILADVADRLGITRIVELTTQGYSQMEIASILGTSQKTVSRRLAELSKDCD